MCVSPRFLALALLALALSAPPGRAAPGSAPDSAALIVYGEHHSFFLHVPQGWRQDSDALKSAGICALFYRPGFSYENAPVILYVNTADPDSSGLDDFIAGDFERFRQDSPRLTVKPQQALTTSDGFKVRVFRLEHAVGPTTSELVGYLAAPTVTVIFVASGKTPAKLDLEASAFAALVRGYGWLTDKITIAH
jgi:hypothetical protein